ncbi:MAG: VCBS repeat-containing protein [Thermoplasmata archaeon]|nr:MAG: VCBS repeat-containing protein [Thermoplasmata archaeon]
MPIRMRRKYVLTAFLAFAMLFGILLPVLGASTGPSIFRYGEKRTGMSYLSSNIVEPGERWSFDTQSDRVAPALAGDVNNDGEEELVFGTSSGMLYVLDKDGQVVWTFEAEGRLSTPPAIGDVDGDSKNEVVIGGSYYNGGGDPNLYVVNGEDGTLLWSFSTFDEGALYTKGFECAPSLYDTNDDGKLDVLIGSRNYYFYAIDGADGSLLWKSQFEHFLRSTSPIGDLDKDGKDEILAVDNHAIVRIFEMDGSLDWEIIAGYGVAATPIFADVDGDGYDEIIIFTFGRADRDIPGAPLVYNHDGSLLWTNEDYLFFYTTPTLADVDGDGLLDIISVDSNDQVLLAYKGTDGTILYNTEPFEHNFMGPGMSTADIDGDGETEVLVAAYPNLYSINAADGTVEWIYDSGGERVGGPLVADLDKDGLAEIFIRIGGNMICLENDFDPNDLLDEIIEYILKLPDTCFKNNADQRKNSLVNKLEAVRDMINEGDYDGAISKLENDIRPKMDGEGNNDWIICEDAQEDLTEMIDELVDYLESLQ